MGIVGMLSGAIALLLAEFLFFAGMGSILDLKNPNKPKALIASLFLAVVSYLIWVPSIHNVSVSTDPFLGLGSWFAVGCFFLVAFVALHANRQSLGRKDVGK